MQILGDQADPDAAPFESIHELRRLMGRLADLVYKKHGHDRLKLFDVLLGVLAAKIHDEGTRAQPLRVALQASDASLRTAFQEATTSALAAIGCSPSAIDIPDDVATIRECLRMLAPFSLKKTVAGRGTGEVLGTFYQEVVSSTFRGSLGAYFTPKPIADLAVALCQPKGDDVVLDPSCGSGTFLLSCLEFARARGSRDPALFGVDIQERMALTASLNAYLHGAMANVIHADGLEISLQSWSSQTPHEQGGFSLIVGNPPFAGHADSGCLPYRSTGNGQVNKVIPFIARAANQLAPGGRAALVLPVSVANAESGPFSELRAWLARHVEVEAILGFTRDAFIHTDCGVEGILLVFRRPFSGKPDLERRAYYREILNLGYDRQGRPIHGSEISGVVTEFHAKDQENHFVPLKELYRYDRWDPLWIRNQQLVGGADESHVPLTEICEVVKRTVKLSQVRDDRDYITFELADVDFDSGEIRSTTSLPGDLIRRKNRLRVLVNDGDILLPNHRDSLIARTGKFVGRSPAIVRAEQAGSITSNRFIVLRPKVEPAVLVYVLNTALVREQLRVLARGSASLDIRDKVLASVRIPSEILSSDFRKRVVEAQAALTQARQQLEATEAVYRDLLHEAGTL